MTGLIRLFAVSFPFLCFIFILLYFWLTSYMRDISFSNLDPVYAHGYCFGLWERWSVLSWAHTVLSEHGDFELELRLAHLYVRNTPEQMSQNWFWSMNWSASLLYPLHRPSRLCTWSRKTHLDSERHSQCVTPSILLWLCMVCLIISSLLCSRCGLMLVLHEQPFSRTAMFIS